MSVGPREHLPTSGPRAGNLVIAERGYVGKGAFAEGPARCAQGRDESRAHSLNPMYTSLSIGEDTSSTLDDTTWSSLRATNRAYLQLLTPKGSQFTSNLSVTHPPDPASSQRVEPVRLKSSVLASRH